MIRLYRIFTVKLLLVFGRLFANVFQLCFAYIFRLLFCLELFTTTHVLRNAFLPHDETEYLRDYGAAARKTWAAAAWTQPLQQKSQSPHEHKGCSVNPAG